MARFGKSRFGTERFGVSGPDLIGVSPIQLTLVPQPGGQMVEPLLRGTEPVSVPIQVGRGLVRPLRVAAGDTVKCSLQVESGLLVALDSRPGFVSSVTAELLNYLDAGDARTRVDFTTEHQLLNAVASSLESSQYRLRQRIQGNRVTQVPLNLDFAGLGYATRMPWTQHRFQTVTGTDESVDSRLSEKPEGLLPPQSCVLDSRRTPVCLTSGDVLLAEVSGTGGPVTLEHGELVLPSRLYLEVLADQVDLVNVEVAVRGVAYPEVVWESGETTEFLRIFDAGYLETSRVWTRISEIAFSSLPAGLTVRLHATDLLLPCRRDPLRNYVSPEDRGLEYVRYWRLEGNELREGCYGGRYKGYLPVHAYRLPDAPGGFVLEPNTYGAWLASGTLLTYFDRRQPLPKKLQQTGLYREPLYFLEPSRNWTLASGLPQVLLIPHPARQAEDVVRWRYRMELPNGRRRVILPDGSWTAETAQSGYRRGVPETVQVPLTQFGTYLFALDCENQQGAVIPDVAAYSHNMVRPLSQFSVRNLVPEVRGLFYDSLQRLWIWTGEMAVPVRLQYDLYAYQPGRSELLVDRNFDQVSVA